MTTNRRFVFNILSAALVLTGVSMFPSICVSVYMKEGIVVNSMSIVAMVLIIAGLFGRRMSGRIHAQVQPRIFYMATVFTWLVLIAVGIFVFYFGVPGYSFMDAALESTASWTTTGIGIYDIRTLPFGLQLWRSTCNWLGGVGIVMVTLSVLSPRQFVGWSLAATEFPGPDFLKSESPFRLNYRKVVYIYAMLTFVQFIMLSICGMEPFNAVLTSLSNSSTSGLQHINNGVATDLSAPIKVIVTMFAFLGSINCFFFVHLYRHKLKAIRDNSELRFYFWRIVLTSLLIALFIVRKFPDRNFEESLGNAVMQVVSFISTSGYIITDCYNWPTACLLFVLLQMFIGSCALSTGGGIKVSRIIIALKSVSYSIYRHIHPTSVRSLTYDKKPIKSDVVIRANLFIALFMMTYLLGALLLSFDDMGLYDALNYSQAMITNTGTSIGELASPGLAEHFTPFTKAMMCILMIAGRLEVYPVMMLFFRNFWNPDSGI